MKHEAPTQGTKHCPECDRNLHVLAFAAASRNVDGLCSRCRECRNAAAKAGRTAKKSKLPFGGQTSVAAFSNFPYHSKMY